MGHFAVHWGNRLEDLARGLFDELYGSPWPTPMIPRCIVTNSPVMQAWLRHYFVYEWPGRQGRVLANCEFQLLYPFVNDWMERLLDPHTGTGDRQRAARHHPYSVACLHWRIYRLLEDGLADTKGFAPIRAYLGDSPSPRRRFQLAGRLATLMDDYQVYRCDVVSAWEQGADADNWQAILWQALVRDQPHSYAALFRSIRSVPDGLLRKRFDGTYRQVAVFGTTAMPVAYVSFLQGVMSRVMDVDLHVLNPSQGDWLLDVSDRVVAGAKEKLLLEDHPLKDDPLLLPEKGHPLLCSLGQGLQEHLHILEEQCGGVSDDPFRSAEGDTMLADLQNRMLARAVDGVAPRPADDSVRVHICHSPRREVEVLHDHLLQWLTADRLQPYQVQVLVPDMATYAPLIDAVFGACPPDAPEAIPYSVDGRAQSGNSPVLAAFRTILNIVGSRFPATSILDLLRGEAVPAAFDMSPEDQDCIEELVAQCGIRWGLDAEHRKEVSGVSMDPQLTWQYGLDRLLIGYATGAAAATGDPWPLDLAEAGSATALGKLARFVSELRRFRTLLRGDRNMAAWHAILVDLVDTFFLSSDTTRGDVARVRRAINELLPLADHAGVHDRPVPYDVVAAHIDGALGASMRGDSLSRNAVVFCQLRPMNSRPAEVVCMLGLNDGEFPRHDNRPTFDLLGSTRKRGDRSDRRDDRCAFLEALVSARSRLFLSYVGRTDSANATLPPSVVLQELRDYLAQTYDLTDRTTDANRLPFEETHRLQSAHPDYFAGGELFSFSSVDLLAARQLARPVGEQGPVPEAAAASDAGEGHDAIELDALSFFFENPARYYYRDVLGVGLVVSGPATGNDEEPFAPGSLDSYLLTSTALKELAQHDYDVARFDMPGFAGRARADGRVPLGARGLEAAEGVVMSLASWLDTPVNLAPVRGTTVRDLLALYDAADPAPADLPLTMDGGTSRLLRGATTLLEFGETRVQIRMRPSKLRTRDRMRGWLQHLFACATAAGDPYTLLLGTDAQEVLAPLPAQRAATLLSDLVELFVAGHVAPMPFAPESSLACCVSWRGADPDGEDAMAAALREASAAWGYRDSYTYTECKDTWLFHAFGEDGPMAQPRTERFAELAVTFFAPLLDAAGGTP